jgi:hypothetical protein
MTYSALDLSGAFELTSPANDFRLPIALPRRRAHRAA